MHVSRWPDIFHARLRSLLRRSRVETELDKEVRFHLDQLIAENLAAGMSMEDARLAALRSMDEVSKILAECRDMRRTNYLEETLRDLHYAARTLLANPGLPQQKA